ncbi:hypothetical protein AMECASPLE_024039 [Ameca splendens]|uniref:Uncharacterized protein n=1 Tax=Ameca splendens TaxID=208324 RepID=A0ABV1ABF2_9TELE
MHLYSLTVRQQFCDVALVAFIFIFFDCELTEKGWREKGRHAAKVKGPEHKPVTACIEDKGLQTWVASFTAAPPARKQFEEALFAAAKAEVLFGISLYQLCTSIKQKSYLFKTLSLTFDLSFLDHSRFTVIITQIHFWNLTKHVTSRRIVVSHSEMSIIYGQMFCCVRGL